jgi:hypothetical protein
MDFSTALEACQRLFGINSYKPRQVECLEAFWQGRDVLAVLPTGYGKSLIFQTLPFIMQQKTGQMMSVIVITPINALMIDQCLKLNSRGIRACYLDYLCESAASAMCDVTDVDDDVETEEAQVTSEVEGQIEFFTFGRSTRAYHYLCTPRNPPVYQGSCPLEEYSQGYLCMGY